MGLFVLAIWAILEGFVEAGVWNIDPVFLGVLLFIAGVLLLVEGAKPWWNKP